MLTMLNGVGQSAVPEKNGKRVRIDGDICAGRDPGSGLRIEVDNQHPEASQMQTCCECERGSRL